jgi:hypothetical protein
MKLVITESQLKHLVAEQIPGLAPTGGYDYQKPAAVKAAGNQAVKMIKNFKLGPHEVMGIAQFASAVLIPPPGGLAVAAAIGVLDAYQYKLENNNRMAGLTLLLAALPGIASVANKVPGIKQLGAKGMAALASKLEKGITTFAPEESAVVDFVSTHLPQIKADYQTWVKNTADTLAKKGVSKAQAKVADVAYNKAYAENGYREMIKQGYPQEMAYDYYKK